MTKPLPASFADWEGNAFGFGYGSGEPHVLAALKTFFAAFGVQFPAGPFGPGDKEPRPNSYDYEKLEAAVTPTVAWLIINVLGHQDIIEYGTSPRYGWLTPHGERLKAFVDAHTADELVEICCGRSEDDMGCTPRYCNCGPNGYEEGRRCDNPFWRK